LRFRKGVTRGTSKPDTRVQHIPDQFRVIATTKLPCHISSLFSSISNSLCSLDKNYNELTVSLCCLGSYSNYVATCFSSLSNSLRSLGLFSYFVSTCFSSISNSLRSLDLSYNELTSLS
jgi:hypothetical protein